MSHHRFALRHRLKFKAEFDLIRAQGRKAVSSAFVLYLYKTARTAEDPSSPLRRLGVIASRRVGNAVHRNRAKRLLREIFRLNPDALPLHCDVLLIARQRIFGYSFSQLQASYLKHCRHLQRSSKRHP